MAPPSIFTRPKRQILGTVGTSRLIREVRSEDQLLVAIAEIASTRPGATGGDLAFAPTGGEIIIAAPISIRAPIEIPPACLCITITSAGYVPITPLSNMASLFLLNAVLVSFRGLFCNGSATAFATSFVKVGSESFAGDLVSVDDCIVVADQVFDGTVGGSRACISNNRQDDVSGTHGASIICGGQSLIDGNQLRDGGGDSITLGASGQGSRIIGNHTGGGDITVTAANPGSTIIGNVMSGGAVNGDVGDIFAGLNA